MSKFPRAVVAHELRAGPVSLDDLRDRLGARLRNGETHPDLVATLGSMRSEQLITLDFSTARGLIIQPLGGAG